MLPAGYVVRKNIDGFEDTYIYHEKYGDFINDVNRGCLKIPGDSVMPMDNLLVHSFA